MEANTDALELWMAVRTQWRASGFGPIGLDYNVLYVEADRRQIDLSPGMMAKIQTLEANTLKRQNHAATQHDRQGRPQAAKRPGR